MKKYSIFLVSFFSIIFLIVFSVFISQFFSFISLKMQLADIPEYSSEEYFRIKIYGSSYTEDGKTISANFAILNEDGNEIAVIERSWSASYLSLDFKEITMDNKKFVFPQSIYGRDDFLQSNYKANQGTSLVKYYTENKECILLGHKSTKEDRHKLYKITAFALGKNIFSLKYKKTVTVDLSSCINGKYYSIVRVPSGNYLIREL